MAAPWLTTQPAATTRSRVARDHNGILAYGDAGAMTGHAKGGNDTINVEGISVAVYGDAKTMTDNTVGGADKLTGYGGLGTTIVGDAETMSGHAKGGKDVITMSGGSEPDSSVAYGDAVTMSGSAAGGDDRIIGSGGANDMWGDARFMFDKAKGGKDTFVFLANSGHDSIHDFKQGMDKIELRGTAAHSFAELKIEKTFLDGKVASLVHFDPNDTSNDITVVTSAKLKASDFLIFV